MSVKRSPQLAIAESAESLEDVVLDLDHTLLNSFEYGHSATRKTFVQPIFESVYCDEDGKPELYNASISRVRLLIKLRPGVRRFLRALADRGAVLHVYTKGARAYMEAVLGLLDPENVLITGSRFAREDDFPSDRKFSHRFSSKRLIILDDSPHIWEIGNSAVLVPVDRYEFAEQLFAPSGLLPASLPTDADFFLHGPVWRKIAQADPPASVLETQDREERKLQYYMELFARQERDEQLKRKREGSASRPRNAPSAPASAPPRVPTAAPTPAPTPAPAPASAGTGSRGGAAPPSATRTTRVEKPVSQRKEPEKPPKAESSEDEGEESEVVQERKKPGRKPRVQREDEGEPDKVRKKPGRKPKVLVEAEKVEREQREAAALMFEIIDEQRLIGRKKVALEILPESKDVGKPLSIPKEMSKPIPTDDFATDPIEWAQQFIKLI